jgi:DNA-directed RNA polymerase subunit omega
MARVTIEDCLLRVDNHFTLTQIAAKRARQLARGASSTLEWGAHKSTVLALQEIAAGQVTVAILDEADLPVVPQPTLTLDPFDPDLQ